MRNIRFSLSPQFNDRIGHSSQWGFSLVEVVVAVGIFALAIVGVIGLLIPTSKGISDVRDADDSSRVVPAIQAYLQKTGFTTVAGYLASPPPTTPVYSFYASRSGDRIGLGTDTTVWSTGTDKEKFFEFALIRNGDSPNVGDGLSPKANDTSSGFLAFTISLRWPAYLPDGTKVTSVAQKTTMIVPTAITR